MPSTSAPPLPLPYSGFFGDNYEVSDGPPLPEAVASSSSTTGMSNSAVIIVIVFSITVIVSISLCFLIRVLRGRCTRRLHTDEQLGRSGGGGGGSSRVMASRRVQPIDDHQMILPIFSYEYANRTGGRVGGGEKSKSATGGGGDCPICLSKFEPKDNLRLLPICCHAFHAECVDLWLESNQSCPLCRSPIVASEAEILQKVLTASTAAPTLRPDPLTLRPVINQPTNISVQPASLVRAESNKTDIGANGSWLRDYMETLSSRTASFRSSGRYFSGGSGRSEMTLPVEAGYWDMEASRAGEEISEMFRWFSGI